MSRLIVIMLLLSLFGAVGISLPVYVFGMLLVLGFGVQLKWLPVAGYEAPGEDFLGERIFHLVLDGYTSCQDPATDFHDR